MNANSPIQTEAAQRRRTLRFLMFIVATWGGMISLGALLFGMNPATGAVQYAPNLIRGAIPFGCVGLFVGGWVLLARNVKVPE